MISNIKDYLDDKHAVGALLINGKWGAGKTWTMTKIKKEYSLSPWWKFWRWRKFRFISLFGINNVEQFKDVLKRKYSPTWYSFHKIIGFIGIAALLGIFPGLGTFIGKLLNFSSSDDSAYYELCGLIGSVIVSLIALFLFIGFYFLINRKIKKRKFIKNNIFVFDDLERCELPMATMLGLINEQVEDGIKVIIIANEDEISEEHLTFYKQFKEKVVLLTLNFSAKDNIDNVFVEIIKKYKSKYKDFLETEKEAIIICFKECAKDNIRALINALSMFERVFNILMNLSFHHKERVLINYLKIFFLVSQGNVVTTIYDSLPYGGLLVGYGKMEEEMSGEDDKDSIESQVKGICSDSFFARSIAIWIETGYFDNHKIEMEINRIADEQKPQEQITIPDSEKILSGWRLENLPDEKLFDAYEKALEIAYEGNTNFDGYINLMWADKRLEILNIRGKRIDWTKFDNGLLKYIDSIETKSNFDDTHVIHHGFIESEKLNKYFGEEAKAVYQRIDEYNPMARKNRKEFLEILMSKDTSKIYSASQSKIFDSFDEEMCDEFVEVYKNTQLPIEKQELLNTWRSMSKTIKHFLKISPESLMAFEKLKKAISNMPTIDNSISQKINEEFIADLHKFQSAIDLTIKSEN